MVTLHATDGWGATPATLTPVRRSVAALLLALVASPLVPPALAQDAGLATTPPAGASGAAPRGETSGTGETGFSLPPATIGQRSSLLDPPINPTARATDGFAGPVRLGNLGAAFGVPPAEPVASGRAWTVRPSLGGQGIFTDNALQSGRSSRSDVIASFTPAVLIRADTTRVQGGFNYTPQAQLYADTPDQNRFDQRFNGGAIVALVPGTLYLDMRGSASTQTLSGGFAPELTPTIDRRNRVQVVNTQISPYITRRFGGFAETQVGYSFQYSTQERDAERLPIAGLPGGIPFENQNFTAHEGYAVVRSGEDFGRLAFEGRLRGTTYTGTGVLANAHRAISVLEARYVVVRGFAALVEGGYETQDYTSLPDLKISEPVWSVGARFDPYPDSFVIARYGRRDGFISPSVEGSLAVGARLRVDGSYNDRLTTTALSAQDLLATTTVDALGNPIDSRTGASVLVGDQFFGTQGGLIRTRRGTVSVTATWPRDRVTLALIHEQRRPVASAPGALAFAQRGTSVSLSWGHEITPRTSSVAAVQYGQFTTSIFGSGDTITGSLGLVHRLTETLAGNLQYIVTDRSFDGLGTGTGNGLQNTVIAGLRKDF